MWRALSATTGEVVVYLDADTRDFAPRLLTGLLGAALRAPRAGAGQGRLRPARSPAAASSRPGEGGRVTELTARPLLNLHRPELAGFAQPLAGEIAARRELLERLAFPVGYGVEIAMLIDALEHAGIDALAEADLGTRQNRHQSLHELSRMSYAVLVAASRRLLGEDAVEALAPGPYVQPGAAPHEVGVRDVGVEERPALASLRARPPLRRAHRSRRAG